MDRPRGHARASRQRLAGGRSHDDRISRASRCSGSYEIDDEGVKAQRVELVENGILENLLMSRRPGPRFSASNGHARSALLSDTQPLSSNLIFQSTDALNAADLHKKFLDACREDGHEWCLEVKRMDNPALSSLGQQDFSDFLGAIGRRNCQRRTHAAARLPRLRSRRPRGTRSRRTHRRSHAALAAQYARNRRRSTVFDYMQNPAGGFAGTALGAFGAAQGGIPSTIVAPSLLLDEVEIRGFHGEPRRLPLVPRRPLK